MNKLFVSVLWTAGSKQGVAGYVFDYKKPFTGEEELGEIKDIVRKKIKEEHNDLRKYKPEDITICLLNWRQMESPE